MFVVKKYVHYVTLLMSGTEVKEMSVNRIIY